MAVGMLNWPRVWPLGLFGRLPRQANSSDKGTGLYSCGPRGNSNKGYCEEPYVLAAALLPCAALRGSGLVACALLRADLFATGVWDLDLATHEV